jgi:hypothetical protein
MRRSRVAASPSDSSSASWSAGVKPSCTVCSTSRARGCQYPSAHEQAHRLRVQAELRPREDLEQLVERAEAAGQRHERIGELAHRGLALVHRADDAQLGQAGVGDLPVDEGARDDADDAPSRRERRVGRLAHQADARPAVDELHPRACDLRPQIARRRRVARANAGPGPAEHADPLHCSARSTKDTSLGVPEGSDERTELVERALDDGALVVPPARPLVHHDPRRDRHR